MIKINYIDTNYVYKLNIKSNIYNNKVIKINLKEGFKKIKYYDNDVITINIHKL
jgi:hypothetical protein